MDPFNHFLGKGSYEAIFDRVLDEHKGRPYSNDPSIREAYRIADECASLARKFRRLAANTKENRSE